MAKLRPYRAGSVSKPGKPVMRFPGFVPGMRDNTGKVLTREEFNQVAARAWQEVTGGDGVMLVDGKPIVVEDKSASP